MQRMKSEVKLETEKQIVKKMEEKLIRKEIWLAKMNINEGVEGGFVDDDQVESDDVMDGIWNKEEIVAKTMILIWVWYSVTPRTFC